MTTDRAQLELKAAELASQAIAVITLAGELLNEGVIDSSAHSRTTTDAENGYPMFARAELERIAAKRLIEAQIHGDEFNVFSDQTQQTLEVA